MAVLFSSTENVHVHEGLQENRSLEPGGYIEITDLKIPYECDDGTQLETHAHVRWTKFLLESSAKLGRPFLDPTKFQSQLESLGLEDVTVSVDKWPMNPWPKNAKYKELGIWACENFSSGVAAISYVLFTHGLGWSKEEVDVFLVDVRKCLRDRSIHAYLPM